MAKTKVNNPRFPHTCKIYREEGATNWDDGQQVVIYEGECRKYKNAASRFNEVIIADYGLSIPGTIEGIKIGDSLDVIDPSGSFTKCEIKVCNPGNLGTTVYFNYTPN
ncbi:hypothetical protein [Bacteroides reticulotermitis]|uniref:Uncharacterized protein n=2 Tax=Bacteroides reticulotermitis TaxID=1133319 RepID=W4URA9_9BACE|nr:hypothetical protein [Bacteroides reticulotermitis]MBB4043813.1 hypothetical protein [Bacteroides reticulotermitis]GAE83332.1 hypothetical protein JCM10512_1597 [Bacteroides reticulotermitis JCM 10512]